MADFNWGMWSPGTSTEASKVSPQNIWDAYFDWQNSETKRQYEAEQKRKAMLPYLETIPGGVFANRLAGESQGMQNYWNQEGYGGLYGEYQGNLAKQAQTGQQPVGDFGSFLNSIDLQKRYNQLTSRQQGFSPYSTDAPRTRFLTQY